MTLAAPFMNMTLECSCVNITESSIPLLTIAKDWKSFNNKIYMVLFNLPRSKQFCKETQVYFLHFWFYSIIQ